MNRGEIVKAFAVSAGVLLMLVAFSTQAFPHGKKGAVQVITVQAKQVAQGASVQEIRVSMREWTFQLNRTSLGVGKVKFLVSNTGSIPHSFKIEGHGIEASTLALAPGKRASLEVTLPRVGLYRIWCPIPGHKERGIVGDLEALDLQRY